MHQVEVTWHTGVDLERIGCRGASSRWYQTRPVIFFYLWTLIGFDRTLADCASGHVVVNMVSMLSEVSSR